jgi:signal transduction histidine kinase
MRRVGVGLSDRLRTGICLVIFASPVIATTGHVLARNQHAPAVQTQRLTQAGILLTDSTMPPPDSAAWQPQTLPDNWNVSRPGVGGFAWYRIEFDLRPEQLRLSALYVPRVSMNGAVMINGEYLGGGAEFGEPMSRQWYRPQFYPIPDKLLRVGANVIHYRVKAYANNKGGLSEVFFGLAAPIENQWRRRYFWQVTSVQITSVLTFSLGAMAMLAWWLRRTNTAYGYFGASALLWAVRNSHFLFTSIPIPAVYWEILAATSLIWVLLLVYMFGLRFANLHLPIAERLVFGFAIAAPFLLWAAGELNLTFVVSLCYLVVLLTGAYLLKVVFDVARRERAVDPIMLFCASIVVYSLGAHDWITQRDILGFSEPYNLHFGAPIFFVAVAWNMFRRFAKAQAEAENFTRSLEMRVREKSAELERNYEQMRAAESARMLTSERERIMRDMHDGVGSQLIAARHLAQRGTLKPEELAQVLDECIDDLRLMIDSLEPTDGDLLTVLGSLRYRLSDRLARQGIELKWEITDLPPIPRLTPRDILQILRIVQEAFANVIKHAQASEVLFSATLAPDRQHVCLSVRDNGRGWTHDHNGAGGRGVANMQQRAATLGGGLYVGSGPGGGVVTLTLPLSAHEVPADPK